MALQIPVDQYRSDYIFLTPATYTSDYVDIVAPIGSSVKVDGSDLTLSTVAIAGSIYSLTSVLLADGGHVIEADAAVGAMVYGYGGPSPPEDARNVSYSYPAGMNLRAINIID